MTHKLRLSYSGGFHDVFSILSPLNISSSPKQPLSAHFALSTWSTNFSCHFLVDSILNLFNISSSPKQSLSGSFALSIWSTNFNCHYLVDSHDAFSILAPLNFSSSVTQTVQWILNIHPSSFIFLHSQHFPFTILFFPFHLSFSISTFLFCPSM